MKFEWQDLTLGDVVETVIDYRGKTPKKLGGDWSNTGYRAFSAKNIKTGQIVQHESIRFVDEEMYHKWMKVEIQKGDILITSEAPFGQIFYWDSDEKIVLSQRLFGVRIKKQYDPRFVYYYMITKEFQSEMDHRATGTTVVGLRQPELMKCALRCPDYETQRKISAILTAIDNKIAVNETINHNLEQQAFALFDHLFPNISDGLCTIGDYITPKRGRNLLSKDAVPGTVPVVAGGLEPSIYHNTANTLAPVLTISASGANAGFVNLWHTPVWSSDSSFIDSSMTEDVYFWFVMLKKRQREIFDAQTGSAQPHIYPQHIAAMTIRSLDKALMSDFASQVTPLFALIGANKDENDRLASVRDALLPKFMSGEIDVSEVEL